MLQRTQQHIVLNVFPIEGSYCTKFFSINWLFSLYKLIHYLENLLYNCLTKLTVLYVFGMHSFSKAHLTIGRETVTGPLPITMVGNAKLPQSLSLVCHTDDATNTVWIFPDGTEVTRQPNATFPEDSIFIYFRHPIDTNQVYLRRKQNVHSPGGSYCCGSATNVTMRLCIDLGKSIILLL